MGAADNSDDDALEEEEEEVPAQEEEPQGDDVDDEDEEDEEEEEGLNDYERDGWLVDEADEEAEEAEEAEEEVQGSEEEEKKEKKRKKKRKEQEQLDEDDYDLLEEAGVIKSKERDKKFKRLKKPKKVAGLDEAIEDLGNDAEKNPVARLEHSLFGDDEGMQDIADEGELPQEEDYEMEEEDEMDDFIVDETDENGEPLRRRKGRKSRAQGLGFSASALQEAQDIFGDVTELINQKLAQERANVRAEEEDEEEEEYDEDGNRKGPTAKALAKQFEPSVLEAKFLTEEDEAIQRADVPERHQLLARRYGVHLSQEISFEKASEWIYERTFGLEAFPSRKIPLDPLPNHVGDEERETKKAIAEFLKLFLTWAMEVPTMGLQRKRMLMRLTRQFYDERLRQSTDSFELLWHLQKQTIRYLVFLKRKRTLEKSVEKLKLNPSNSSLVQNLQEMLEFAENEFQLEDVEAILNFLKAKVDQSGDPSQLKRPLKSLRYWEFDKLGIGKLAKSFGVDIQKVADLLVLARDGEERSTSAVSEEMKTITISPDDFALDFICTQLPKSEHALKAARHMLAVDIFLNPQIREYLRTITSSSAVSTIAVPGTDVNQSRFAPVLWLEEKPFSEFKDEQWLIIEKGEEEGVVKVDFKFRSGATSDMLFRDVEAPFLVEGTTGQSYLWNKERTAAVQQAVLDHLIPLMEKERRAVLRRAAKSHLMEKLTKSLFELANVSPYLAKSQRETDRSERSGDFHHRMEKRGDFEEGFEVVSVVWGPGNPPTTMVAIDSYGELKEEISLSHLLLGMGLTYEEAMEVGIYAGKKVPDNLEPRKNDMVKLVEFLKSHSPRVIVVGASNVACRKLRAEIETASAYVLDSYSSGGGGVGAVPDVIMADETFALLYENSAAAEAFLPHSKGIVRRAVGLARTLQNKTAVIASLFSPSREILSLRLHPWQELLSEDDRMEALEQAMVSVTSQLPIPIQSNLDNSWLSPLVQFVPGFGPRKASEFLRRVGPHIQARKDLPRQGLMGGKIFFNTASNWLIQGGKEELDETRIHPDKYRLAGEIASCSLKLSDGLSSKYQKEVDPIHYYREHSEATTFVTVERFPFDDISLLCFIQRELRRPFEDYREPYIEPSAEEEFFLLTGETKETLGDGKVVRATVRRVSESKILCALESGLPAWINPQDLPEELRYRGRSMQEGDVLSCRVKEIKAQEFAVQLTCLKSGYGGEEFDFPDVERDQYFSVQLARRYEDGERQKEKEKAEEEKKKRRQMFKPRMINFPLFKNVSMDEAIQVLSDEEVGAFVLRPSSKGPSHLCLTLKFFKEIYTHTDIREEGKDKRNPTSYLRLGDSLTIGEDRFEDLDEVVASYVDPLVKHLREILDYRKFKALKEEELDAYVEREKQSSPDRIPYYFGVSWKHPGAIRLTYVRGRSATHEYLTVTPKGFRFRKKDFKSPDSLVKYFQTTFNEPVKSSHATWQHPARTSNIPNASGWNAVNDNYRRPQQATGYDSRGGGNWRNWDSAQNLPPPPPRPPGFVAPVQAERGGFERRREFERYGRREDPPVVPFRAPAVRQGRWDKPANPPPPPQQILRPPPQQIPPPPPQQIPHSSISGETVIGGDGSGWDA